MFHILVTGKIASVGLEILRAEKDLSVTFLPDCPRNRLLALIGDYDALVSRSETRVDKALLDRARRLKVIARAAVGVGNIDVEYATEKGILVMNTPGMNTNSAAELTFGFLIAAYRKIIPAHLHLQASGWDRHRFMGRELRGKTLGIIGLGNVGHRVARFGQGFDMKVLAYDPYLAASRFEQLQVESVRLETLCEKADVITLHVPLNDETRLMIGRDEIARMKKGVVLLNAARGGVVDEEALLDALKNGHVGFAGIDTWANEPLVNSPFVGLENVVMTPHIGAGTIEAQEAVGRSIALQTIRALRGEVVDFPVNMPQFEVLEGTAVRPFTVLAERLGRFAAQFIEFVPSRIDVLHRGLPGEDLASLVRLCFLKGFLQHSSDDSITHVNADRRAALRGLDVCQKRDSDYCDYESSVRFVLSAVGKSVQVAGVVHGGGHIRMTRVNNFDVEMEPRGILLVTRNIDRPGMIGRLGMALGNQGLNIDQFELGRKRPGGEALALIRIDQDVPDAVVAELRALDGIVSVRRIRL